MKIQNVIFDMDGVLFDSERAYEEGLFQNAAKYGISPTHDVFLKTVGTSEKVSKAVFLETYGDFDYDALREDIRGHLRSCMESGRIPLKPGVHNILQFLKESGVRIALATSTRRNTTMQMLETAGLFRYFDETVCGDEVRNAKPDPDIFLKAMEELGGDRANTLIVEDSHNGIRAANAAGIPVVMVPDLLPPLPELDTLAVVQDLNEARRFIAPLVETPDGLAG